MCSMSVLCPLCCQLSFATLDALRVGLIEAANGMSCPICHERFLGLDKLTIHLFSHASLTMGGREGSANRTTPPKTVETQPIASPSSKNASKKTAKNPKDKTSSRKVKQPKTAIKEAQQPAAMESTLNAAAELSTCDICEFTFRNAELRDMHIRLVHQNPHTAEEQPHQSAIHTSDANQAHDFKCHLCAKTFKMKGSLRVHLKVVHLMGLSYVNNSPKLNICDRIRHKENKSKATALVTPASQSQVLAQHLPPQVILENPHPANTLEFSPQLLLPITSTPPVPPNGLLPLPASIKHDAFGAPFSCSDVPMHSSTPVLLIDTRPIATAPAAPGQPNQPVTETITEPLAATKASFDNPKIWECDVCSKAFTTKYFLKKHKRLHTGEMPYTCELCARTFTFQQSYHKHLLYHSDEKPHVCSTCGRSFKELSTLHNHERIHSGEKPFKCEVCGKCFRQRVSFLVHTRIHTGVMPYKCEVCLKSFRYKVSQRTHKCLQSPPPGSITEAPAEEELGPNSQDTVDRISETFIKAFLESNTTLLPENGLEISASPATLKPPPLDHEALLLSRTIDEFVVESCNKLGIGGSPEAQRPPAPPSSYSNGTDFAGQHLSEQLNISDGSSSPSQKLQNMRLYSPQRLVPDFHQGSDFTGFTLDEGRQNLM